MKRQTLAYGLLSFVAVSMMTGCVDDKYDLTDIDTTSRFTVDDLTVPINLEKITLKNVIDIDEDDNLIKQETVDGELIYTIVQSGSIASTEFKLGSVNVNKVDFNPLKIKPNITGFPSGVTIPELQGFFPLSFGDNGDEGLQQYNFKFENIDKNIKSIDTIATSPISIDVTLGIPSSLLNGDNKINFTDLSIVLPKGLSVVSCNVFGASSDNVLTIPRLQVEKNGKAHLALTADTLAMNKEIGENRMLDISGPFGIRKANIDFDVKNIVIPENFAIDIEYSVSGFSVKSFTGKVDYDMGDLSIEPITLNDLPDFLNNPKTNIIIDNPLILVTIQNPVGKYGLQGKGIINLESNFSNGSVAHYGNFDLTGEESRLAFCSDLKNSSVPSGYQPVEIKDLDKILTNGDSGLPSSISVKISDLNFNGTAEDLPIGEKIGDASGEYTFKAPFAFGEGTKIFYNTTESGWGSDDLDKLNINNLQLSATCTSDLPVDISLEVKPIDKNGDIIEVEEQSSFIIPAHCVDKEVGLTLKGKGGKPIKDFDGVIFEAVVEQKSNDAQALGPNIELDLTNIRITVSGYYETDF